jgi:hypothetical protein
MLIWISITSIVNYRLLSSDPNPITLMNTYFFGVWPSMHLLFGIVHSIFLFLDYNVIGRNNVKKSLGPIFYISYLIDTCYFGFKLISIILYKMNIAWEIIDLTFALIPTTHTIMFQIWLDKVLALF